MTFEITVGLGIAIALFIYLIFALVKAENFR